MSYSTLMALCSLAGVIGIGATLLIQWVRINRETAMLGVRLTAVEAREQVVARLFERLFEQNQAIRQEIATGFHETLNEFRLQQDKCAARFAGCEAVEALRERVARLETRQNGDAT